LMAYLVLWTALRRHPMLAVIGAVAFGTAILSLFHHYPGAGHWAFQVGFVFLLLHSLRWTDKENPGANFVRLLAGFFWVLQSLIWMNSDTSHFWMPLIPGTVVLAVCFACRLYQLEWKKSFVPVAAMLVMLSGPGTATVEGLRTAPVGLLAVTASFLIFGFGTLAALTRHHWHKPENGIESGAARTPATKP